MGHNFFFGTKQVLNVRRWYLNSFITLLWYENTGNPSGKDFQERLKIVWKNEYLCGQKNQRVKNLKSLMARPHLNRTNQTHQFFREKAKTKNVFVWGIRCIWFHIFKCGQTLTISQHSFISPPEDFFFKPFCVS